MASTRKNKHLSPLVRRTTLTSKNRPTKSAKSIVGLPAVVLSRAYWTKRRILITYGLVLGVTAISAVTLAKGSELGKPALPSPFNSSQTASVAHGLYYPASLPSGLSIDSASISAPQGDRNGITSFHITNGVNGSMAGSIDITVNQQPKPAASDAVIQTFQAAIDGRQEIKTAHGTAVVGTIDNGRTRMASLATNDGTWILMSCPTASVDQPTLAAIVRDFTR